MLELDGIGLMNDYSTPAPSGQPMMLALDAIDEDADQPRLEFDDETLRELADSIRERGVKQPVSVRPHPTDANRWLLNFGARRLRASRLAGKADIPAFVDSTVDTYDQVIENEQREGLKPLELALFVQRRLAQGESRLDIAKRLGKSPSYVSVACALIDAPDWLMTLYRTGQCTGLAELYELRRLQPEPEAVARWTAEHDGKLTRSGIQSLKESLQSTSAQPDEADQPEAPTAPPVQPTVIPTATREFDAPKKKDKAEPATTTLWATWDGAEVAVDVTAVPDEAVHFFIVREGQLGRLAVPASELQLLRITCGRFNR